MVLDLQRRTELDEQGFTYFPQLLDAAQVQTLRAVTERMLARHDNSAFRSQGSMLKTNEDEAFADLIALPAALAALSSLGFARPTFSDGYIISKPPHSPRLFWHYDWFAWDDARNRELPAPQIFLMYYLSDTTPENGCLRVIPGSHIKENVLHRLLAEPHSKTLGAANDSSRVEFSDRPDESNVLVKAGDLLIGDARLLHAAHSNQTDKSRTLITLWYQPDLESLPERIQAQMAAKTHAVPEHWSEAAKAKILPLLANQRYQGTAEPHERQLWRPRNEPISEGEEA